jgi:hypothetical protein
MRIRLSSDLEERARSARSPMSVDEFYGIGLAKRDRTLARLSALLEQYRMQPATFACTLVPRRAPGTPRSGCA